MPSPLKLDQGFTNHSIGRNAMNTPIKSWHCNALMTSVGHCPGGKTRKYEATGNFYVWKREVAHQGGTVFTFGDPYHCCGVAGCSTGPGQFNPGTSIPSFESATSGLTAQYATGYARARPGNPVASVAQFVAELRDFPAAPFRSIFGVKKVNRRYGHLTMPVTRFVPYLQRKAFSFRNLGSEYLNYAFGWVPFVSDVRKMFHLWHDVDKRLAQIVRENGRVLTRRAKVLQETTVERGGSLNDLVEITHDDAALDYDWTPRVQHLPPPVVRTLRGTRRLEAAGGEATSYSTPFQNVFGAPSSLQLKGTTKQTVMRVTQKKEWFTGKFQYHIPDVGSSQWTRNAKLALFGANVTPEVLWELMPWSWLIDWFSNVGDVISNLSPNAVGATPVLHQSGIHRTYFSKTVHSVTTHVDTPSGVNTGKWGGGDFSFQSSDQTYSKCRIGSGNPYGLGAKIGSLSAGQLSILTALGLSKGKVR